MATHIRPLRTMVLDDDSVSRSLVTKCVEKTPFLELVAAHENPEEALVALQNKEVDFLLLDVEMPEMSGLDLLRNQLEALPLVVLVTSKEEHALEAFELEVTDYVLKPFNYARFLKAAERVRERFAQQQEAGRLDEAQEVAAEQGSQAKELYVKHQSRYVKIPYMDIIWVEAIGDYVEIYTEQKKYTVHTTMKGVEARLPSSEFLRVHRSYIVRLDRILELEDNTVAVGKKLVPIGKSYRQGLMEKLNLL